MVTTPNPLAYGLFRFAQARFVLLVIQVEIFGNFLPVVLLPTTLWGFLAFDHFTLAQDLDFATWDSYPLGHAVVSWFDGCNRNYLRRGHPDLLHFTMISIVEWERKILDHGTASGTSKLGFL